MCSSPTPPAGTGRSWASRTCSRTPSIGRPTPTGPSARYGAVIGALVLNSVASVAPYIARTTRPGLWSSTRRTAAGAMTSPPVSTSRTPARQPGSSSASTRNSPAVRWMPVIRSSAMSPRRACTSRSPGGATTIRPPCSSGTQNSYVETLKAYGATISTRSCRPSAQIESRARPSASRWAIATPFGSPVEPEVWIT